MKNILKNYEDLLIADGYDDAIVGISSKKIVVYSINKIVEILMAEGMTDEEALEFFEYNIEGSYVGEKTPIYMWVE
jgi:hypothetical protein